MQNVNQISIEEYTQKFINYFISKFSHYTTFTEIYFYNYEIQNIRTFTFQSKCVLSDERIVEKWLRTIFPLCDLTEIIQFMYENVDISDIELYIKIAKCMRVNKSVDRDLCCLYLELHKTTPNLNFTEIINICHFSLKNISNETQNEIIIEKCKTNIKIRNNEKISELWWVWKDFSGNHSNYIEWLPRETLGDLLMIKHSGEYQPDYTTYIN